ncbi:MAG: Ubiquinone biosynthesis O-methyltransferase [Nitrosomonadaceae bacterium]|nr:Ubiquinone biosynthesis O-methyltransferase [Nitrosomonadaceae bacterium]
MRAMNDQAALSSAYDKIAEHTNLYPEFYRWVVQLVAGTQISRDAAITDIGCGTGRMLEELKAAGYTQLAGVDFSQECASLTKKRVPDAQVWQHNILDGPVEQSTLIVMSEVIEHVTNPRQALLNVKDSLVKDGWLVLTFPNKLAYWPLYYLSPLRKILPQNERLQHWFTWFTMPYEMRSTQPNDNAYTVDQVRGFLQDAGFTVQEEYGHRLFPMLRIRGLGWIESAAEALERTIGRFLPKAMSYRYMFVTRKTGVS